MTVRSHLLPLFTLVLSQAKPHERARARDEHHSPAMPTAHAFYVRNGARDPERAGFRVFALFDDEHPPPASSIEQLRVDKSSTGDIEPADEHVEVV